MWEMGIEKPDHGGDCGRDIGVQIDAPVVTGPHAAPSLRCDDPRVQQRGHETKRRSGAHPGYSSSPEPAKPRNAGNSVLSGAHLAALAWSRDGAASCG